MGDGIEQGWLSPYLIGRGLSLEQSAGLFTMYGVTIAISAWFSGVLAEAYGVKRTMFAGLVLYLLGTCGFVGLSLPGLHYPLMLATYALRGFGYPLFAYSFLVWIAYAAPKNGLGKAVGWFWFVFTGGLNVLGAYYSSWAIERIGNINTLWTSVFWALLGAFFALVMNKSQKRLAVAGGTREKMRELLKGITIMKQEPKVLLGGIVRVINTTAQFAFPVFLPMYMADYGFTTTEWLGSGHYFHGQHRLQPHFRLCRRQSGVAQHHYLVRRRGLRYHHAAVLLFAAVFGGQFLGGDGCRRTLGRPACRICPAVGPDALALSKRTRGQPFPC